MVSGVCRFANYFLEFNLNCSAFIDGVVHFGKNCRARRGLGARDGGALASGSGEINVIALITGH